MWLLGFLLALQILIAILCGDWEILDCFLRDAMTIAKYAPKMGAKNAKGFYNWGIWSVGGVWLGWAWMLAIIIATLIIIMIRIIIIMVVV
jgi:hypothetical protein